MKKERVKQNKKRIKTIDVFFLISILLPFAIAIKPILFGHFPFWYDPARDLLLAWDNLKKLTLIGPSTGIPGIFYGPYWIWLLSIGLMISKDPRFVLFIVLTIPYFVILPLLLYRFAKFVFDKTTMIILWLLFILSFMQYTNQIWNPNLAPLIFFIIVFSIVRIQFNLNQKIFLKNTLLIGILQGLLLNFHVSFGLGIFVSTILYFLIHLFINFRKNNKKLWKIIFNWFLTNCMYSAGIIVMFLPTLFFESRHGFNQIKSILFTLNKAVIYKQAVVGQTGLSKEQIVSTFIEKLSILLQIPHIVGLICLLGLFGLIIYRLFKKKQENYSEKNLSIFLLLNCISILFVYLSSKNPVWDYHFVGVEVIFILCIGLIIKNYPILKKVIVVWVCIILILNITTFIQSLFKGSRYTGLSAEKADVENIFIDSHSKHFVYLAKNAAIYTFDYDYLFRWLGKKYSFIPKNEIGNESLVYLLIPPELLSDKIGFVENRTPSKKYKTAKEWKGKDGVLIIRREIKK